MLKVSGVCTGVGSFTRKDGSSQATIDIEGIQVNWPSGLPLPSVGQELTATVVARQLANGRMLFAAVPLPSARS